MAFGAFQSAAPAAATASPAAQRKSPIALWLLLPGILYLILSKNILIQTFRVCLQEVVVTMLLLLQSEFLHLACHL